MVENCSARCLDGALEEKWFLTALHAAMMESSLPAKKSVKMKLESEFLQTKIYWYLQRALHPAECVAVAKNSDTPGGSLAFQLS